MISLTAETHNDFEDLTEMSADTDSCDKDSDKDV